MFKLLIIPIVVVLLTIASSHPAAAHSQVQRDFTSKDDSHSESKRLYGEGVKYALAGLYSQAAALFQQAVRLNPKFADAHFALGHAYFDMKRWQMAIDSFQRAIDLNPRDQEAHDRLSLAREMLDRERNPGAWESKPRPKESSSRPRESNPRASEPASFETAPQPAGEPVALNAKPTVTLNAKPAAEPAKTAETSTNEANAAANELSLTRIYRVGPGDVLDVRISDSPAPQSTLFTVTPAGLLEHPLLAEPLHVGGLRVEEVSSSIEADLKRRALMASPKVSVAVRDYASHTILVSGLVKDSGTKILRREAIPLYVVIADAQPLPEAGRVTVLRNESNATFEVELTESSEMNLLVRPGDVITL